MKVSFASSILLAAGFVAAVSARADAQSMTLGATPAASATSGSQNLPDMNSPSTLGTNVPHTRFGWAGIGIYHISVSFDNSPLSFGDTNFGFNAGGAVDIIKLAPDLPLSIFGNIAIAFGSDFTLFPITAGAAVHYDKFPVQLFGGLGLTIMPVTNAGETPIGIAIYTMASYPLPQVYPGLAAMAQVQYHIMDDNFSLFVFNVGGTIGF
jgi:hypothetical protein